jgi:hypothetical protein
MKRLALVLLLQSFTFNFPETRDVREARDRACHYDTPLRDICYKAWDDGRREGLDEFFNRLFSGRAE